MLEGFTCYESGGRLDCVTVRGDQETFVAVVTGVELKSLEQRELQDDLEHRSYKDGSILELKVTLVWTELGPGENRETESPGFFDAWHHHVRVSS